MKTTKAPKAEQQSAYQPQYQAAKNTVTQSEDKFMNFFEHSPVGISLTTPQGGVDVNEPFANMLGYTKEELVSTWESIAYPEDIAATQKIVKSLLEGEVSTARFKKRYLHKNGTVVWTDVSTYLQRDANGNPEYFITAVNDITNDMLNVQKLLEANLYAENLIFNSKAPIIVWDTQFIITWYNPAFALIKGISCEEIKGRHISILFPPEKIDHYLELIRNMTAGERWDVEEMEIINQSGKIYTLLWNSALLYAEDKTTPVAALFQGTDVTRRLESENSLKQSLDRYAVLFDTMPIGWAEHKMLFKADGTPDDYIFLDANPAFEHFIGDKRSNILGKKASEVILDIKFVKPNLIDYYGHIVTSGEQSKSELYIATFERWYSITSFRNKPGHFVVMYEDITDRKAGEKEIIELNASLERKVIERTELFEATNKELETFTYSVSHDLRAPLRHISGYIELLISKFKESIPEKGARYLDIVLESTHQMGRLIDDLLAFSRTGRIVINLVKVDMNDVIDEVLTAISGDIEGKNIEWKITDLPLTACDAVMIKLVWVNLILNAIKFSGNKAPAIIEIGCETHPDKYEFYVRDNGVGFDMKYADKLFGVFQRLHPASQFEGTGIGLANVRRIIAKHGGETWATAEVDKGATFSFTIPR